MVEKERPEVVGHSRGGESPNTRCSLNRAADAPPPSASRRSSRSSHRGQGDSSFTPLVCARVPTRTSTVTRWAGRTCRSPSEAQMGRAALLMMSTKHSPGPPANGPPTHQPDAGHRPRLYYATRERKFSKGSFRDGSLTISTRRATPQGYLRGVSRASTKSAWRTTTARSRSTRGSASAPRATTASPASSRRPSPLPHRRGSSRRDPVRPGQQDARQEGAVGPHRRLLPASTATRRTVLSSRTASARSASTTRPARAFPICMDHMVESPAGEEGPSGARRRPRSSASSTSTRRGSSRNGERYNKIVDIWAGVADKVTQEMMNEIGKEEDHRSGDRQGAHRAELSTPSTSWPTREREGRPSRSASSPRCEA